MERRRTILHRTLATTTAFALAAAPLGAQNAADAPPAPRPGGVLGQVTRQLGQTSTTTQNDAPSMIYQQSPLAARVDQAVARAVEYLKRSQKPDGSWVGNNNVDTDAGRTALAVMALINAGENVESPAIQRAVTYMKSVRERTTYGTALRACAYSLLPERLRKAELAADVRWLIQAKIDKGDAKGMYSYGAGDGRPGDYSNSQYGTLGVWYAALAGVEVPVTYWRDVEAAWKKGQNDDGGWFYLQQGGGSYGSMTVAGVATLAITEEYVGDRGAFDLARLRSNLELQRGLDWLGRNFAVNQNPGLDAPLAQPGAAPRVRIRWPDVNENAAGRWIHYMLFGYERVGEITGYTRFGDAPWFELGAEYLLSTQNPDGSWIGTTDADVSTAYGLLFLTRGQAPVIVQKLKFDGRWNNRPLDARRIARWLSKTYERHLNWQVLDIDLPQNEFRQAPILLIASDRNLIRITPEQEAKLKRYIDEGGLLLVVNEGKGEDLIRWARKFATTQLAPYELRDLPPGHPIVKANFPMGNFPGKIQGVSNGVRELMLLIPDGDLTWKWHGTVASPKPDADPMHLPGNLYLYVTDAVAPPRKGQQTWVDRAVPSPQGPAVKVARVKFEGNWNPEPLAWERFANVMANQNAANVAVEVTPAAALDPKQHTLAHLTDTGAFKLTDAEEKAIKQYLDGGGTLLFDAAGGNTDAATSFEKSVAKLYPGQPLKRVPIDHPLIEGRFPGGQRIDLVGYRTAVLERLNVARLPRLSGVEVNGRLVAIEATEDLTAGLAGYARSGLIGYTPASSAAIVKNILLYAASQKRQ